MAAGSAKPAAAPKSARRKLFDLHAWLGFHLAVLMTVVLATGTIATVSHEIDWLVQDDMRVSPDGEMVSWGEMEAAVRAFRPNGQIVFFGPMEGDHFAYRARVAFPGGGYEFVHVNQWTGEVTGTTHALTVQRFFRDLHRHLFMPNVIGLPLVTSLAFILAASLYTGLKTARNWRTLMFRVRTNKGPRVLVGDAHKAAGLWASWFFLVIIVTGIWYLFEFGAYVATGNRLEPDRARLAAERTEAFGSVIEDRPLGEVVAAAQDAFPALRITQVQYPRAKDAPFVVLGERSNPLLRQRANRVFLDPETLAVVELQRSEDIGALAYLNEMADPLHFGFFGGLPTKTIWFVFGIGMTGLSVTGVWLTWRRVRTASLSRTQAATFPVLLLSLAFATQWYERYQIPPPPRGSAVLATFTGENGVTVRTVEELDEAGRPTGTLRVEVGATRGRPNLDEVTLVLGEARHVVQASPSGGRIEASFDIPPGDWAGVDAFRLELRLNGTVLTKRVELRS